VSGGVGPLILNLALDKGDWLTSRTSLFIPGERAPNTHWTQGRVGPWDGL